MADWHDDDEFWRVWEDKLFTPRHWENAPEEVRQALELVEIREGTHVLDLCCGTGRHSLELARLGYQVTAVDRTADYLRQLRESADEQGLSVETVHQDMREFHRADAFDAAINLYTSFGYFEEQSENVLVIENLFASLRPGGSLVMEMMGKEVLARIYQATDWREMEDGAILAEERQVENDWSLMRNRWILFSDGERIEHRLTHWIYSAAEMKGILGDAGFEDIQAYGHLRGIPYDQNAERLVVTAKKPG